MSLPNVRGLALFDLAIDSKLRACDLKKLRVRDVAHGNNVAARAMVMQRKTQRPVQFEITAQTRLAVEVWVQQARLRNEDYLFPSRLKTSEHLSTRQYLRIVKAWVSSIGLNPVPYGPHTMRRTKASLIYRRKKTSEPYRSFLATPSWKARSGILASKWTTHARWPSRLRFDYSTAMGQFPRRCRRKAAARY